MNVIDSYLPKAKFYPMLFCQYFLGKVALHILDAEICILSFVQGAGAFEVAARQYLINEVKKTVKGVTKCFQIFHAWKYF